MAGARARAHVVTVERAPGLQVRAVTDFARILAALKRGASPPYAHTGG